MFKVGFDKRQNKSGNSVIHNLDNCDYLPDEDNIEILKSEYDDCKEALHALNNSNWYNAMNYRFELCPHCCMEK